MHAPSSRHIVGVTAYTSESHISGSNDWTSYAGAYLDKPEFRAVVAVAHVIKSNGVVVPTRKVGDPLECDRARIELTGVDSTTHSLDGDEGHQVGQHELGRIEIRIGQEVLAKVVTFRQVSDLDLQDVVTMKNEADLYHDLMVGVSERDANQEDEHHLLVVSAFPDFVDHGIGPIETQVAPGAGVPIVA